MTRIVSRFINFSIPRPEYLDVSMGGMDQCSGLVFETQYKGKTLYVGLGGGELVTKVGCEEIRDISDDEELALTPVGHLVLDILIALPVECPSLTIAEILDSTAADPDDLLSRVHRILDKAANFSKIMIIGDFTKALDGKVTPLLGIEGVVEVEDLPGYSEDEVV